ncbi:MAG: response regulator [Herpetosiphonaceae bacterium]|nr:response regulator [Herpetosiphonaceae bacterium]
MSGPRVLIVDDERQMRRLLEATLLGHDYTVLVAATGREALNLAATARPEVIVLDLGLPDLDGLEVCRRIRAWSQIPIIVVSARDEEQAKVEALDLGADDYLTKPFGMNELLARLRVALRHVSPVAANDPVVRFDSIEVDFNRRMVLRNGAEIHLTPIEYNLLRLLVTNPERVLTQKYVLRTVWGPGYEAEAQTLRVHIGQLRRKIEPDPTQPSYIQTEVGIGYRFRMPSSIA